MNANDSYFKLSRKPALIEGILNKHARVVVFQHPYARKNFFELGG